MSYAISVLTPFNDIAELAESFYSRVDEERLMLPNEESIPEGEWVDFAVTLADGTAALAGQGRCTGSYDNGEDRAPEHRFDVVIDSLQFDELAQVYFERILQVRASHAGDEPATGEVEVPHGEPADEAEALAEVAPAEEYAEAPPAEEYAEAPPAEENAEAPPAEENAEALAEPAAEEAPVEVDPAAGPGVDPAIEDLESMDGALLEDAEGADSGDETAAPPGDAAPPAAPQLSTPTESRIYELPAPSAPGALPSPHGGDEVLTRPFLQATWSPEPLPRFDPSPSSGYFQYAVGAGLPRPAEPPRPELDPSMHVAPAPRPGDPHEVPVQAPPAADGAEMVEEGYADEVAPAEGGYAEEAATEGEHAEEVAPAEGGHAEEAATEGEHAQEVAPAEGGYAEEAATEGEHAQEVAPAEGGYAEEAATEGEYAGDAYGDGATLDADTYGGGVVDQDATMQHDVSGLPDDPELGTETLQVEIPEDTDD